MSKSFETEYKNSAMNNVPNLWDRIEAGIDEIEASEQTEVSKENSEEKKSKKKILKFNQYIGIAAAVVLLAIVFVSASAIKSSSSGRFESEAPSATADCEAAESIDNQIEAESGEDYETVMAEETVAEESMTEETVTEESVTEETVMEEIKTEDSADEESMNTNAMLGEALTGETAEYSTNEVNTTEDAMRKDFAMKADMDKADMSKSGEEEKKMIDDGDAYNSKKLITGKVKGVAVNETLRGVEYVIVDETEKGLIIKVQKDANGLLEQNGFFEVYAAADVKDEMLKECAGNKDTVFNNPLEYIGNNMFSIEKTE